MPSIAHFIVGGFFGICLYFISDGKFTKTHVFILFLCNYLGPDVGWAVGLGTITHSLLGWPFFAFILSLFYHYFTRFSLEIDGFKNIELIELEQNKLSYLQVYFLVLASGIMHNYLDGMMNYGGIFHVVPQIAGYEGFSPTLDDFMKLFSERIIEINIIIPIMVGISFIFGFVFVFVYFLKKMTLNSVIITFFYILAFMLFFYLAGELTTLYHPDAGAIVYVSIFWILPLMLCVLSTKDIKFVTRSKENVPKKKEKKHQILHAKLILISTWMLLGGLSALFVSLFGFLYNDIILDVGFSSYGDEISKYFSYDELFALFLAAETVILVISLINISSAVGLLLKKKPLWKLAVYMNLIFSWTLIGLTIACALSEESVKDLFNSKILDDKY